MRYVVADSVAFTHHAAHFSIFHHWEVFCRNDSWIYPLHT